VQTTFPGERFVLRTPTDGVTLIYPGKSFTRVNSYIDAMALTPQEDATIRVGSTPERTVKGQTITLSHNHVITPATTVDPNAFTEWNNWTTERVAAWDKTTNATMKEAGLTSPIPGLAELKDHGTFFACSPTVPAGSQPMDGRSTKPPQNLLMRSSNRRNRPIHPNGNLRQRPLFRHPHRRFRPLVPPLSFAPSTAIRSLAPQTGSDT
jgi:hypothetical protein